MWVPEIKDKSHRPLGETKNWRERKTDASTPTLVFAAHYASCALARKTSGGTEEAASLQWKFSPDTCLLICDCGLTNRLSERLLNKKMASWSYSWFSVRFRVFFLFQGLEENNGISVVSNMKLNMKPLPAAVYLQTCLRWAASGHLNCSKAQLLT